MDAPIVPTVGTPSPPFIEVEGVHNFRDIGGYALSNPTTSVRRHIIYRCGEPSGITDEGKKKIVELGITTFFDLRSTPEVESQRAKSPYPDIPGVSRVFAPVFEATDYSPERLAVRFKDYAQGGPQGFSRAYADILANAPLAFNTVFSHLRDHPGQPCVVHCTAGKDRTGVLVALVLGLLRVPDAVIAAEYALTERGLAPLQPAFLEHVLGRPTFTGTREDALKMFSAKAENMLAVLKMIRDAFGDAEGYLRQRCMLSGRDIEKIRKSLTSQDAAIL